MWHNGKRFIRPVMPVLSTVLSVGVRSSLYIHLLFDFDPIQVLSLGTSKLLKECFISMLGNAERTTCAMKKRLGSSRIFKSIKRFVLESLNRFLRKMSCVSPGPGPEFDISHSHPNSTNNGLFRGKRTCRNAGGQGDR